MASNPAVPSPAAIALSIACVCPPLYSPVPPTRPPPPARRREPPPRCRSRPIAQRHTPRRHLARLPKRSAPSERCRTARGLQSRLSTAADLFHLSAERTRGVRPCFRVVVQNEIENFGVRKNHHYAQRSIGFSRRVIFDPAAQEISLCNYIRFFIRNVN